MYREAEDGGDPRERAKARHKTDGWEGGDALAASWTLGCPPARSLLPVSFRIYGEEGARIEMAKCAFGWLGFFRGGGRICPCGVRGQAADTVSVFACGWTRDGFGKLYGLVVAVFLNFRGNSG